MDGMLRCARYAFGPNRLHYCGPNKSEDIAAHIGESSATEGLRETMTQFETMYPYLRHIAHANAVGDPLDARVVEAYWLGNELLTRAGGKPLYRLLFDTIARHKKGDSKFREHLIEMLRNHAVPHHSFHVFSIWKKENAASPEELLAKIDECRIGWGEITDIAGPKIIVKTRLLERQNDGRVRLSQETTKVLIRRLESEYDIDMLEIGDTVSYHWSVPCEKISPEQAARLEYATRQNIGFINTSPSFLP